MSRSAPLLAAFALAVGCARAERPDVAYRALVDAVRVRDAERAWELLSSRTRAWLDARAKAAAARAPGVVPASGKELLLGGGGGAVRPPRSVVVLRESPDRAVLQVVEDGGEPREVTMVNEGGWRLDLAEPPAGAG